MILKKSESAQKWVREHIDRLFLFFSVLFLAAGRAHEFTPCVGSGVSSEMLISRQKGLNEFFFISFSYFTVWFGTRGRLESLSVDVWIDSVSLVLNDTKTHRSSDRRCSFSNVSDTMSQRLSGPQHSTSWCPLELWLFRRLWPGTTEGEC